MSLNAVALVLAALLSVLGTTQAVVPTSEYMGHQEPSGAGGSPDSAADQTYLSSQWVSGGNKADGSAKMGLEGVQMGNKLSRPCQEAVETRSMKELEPTKGSVVKSSRQVLAVLK